MASLFDSGIFSVISADGAALPGALLFWYANRTTTKVDTYTTLALDPGLKNTNPVVADANGRFPSIWLADATYTYVLKTAAGVVLSDQDDFTPPGAALRLGTGASLVGFQNSGTGAVLTDLLTRGRHSVLASDFGVVGDGVTDDAANINKALASLGTTGGTVIIPRGFRCLIDGANLVIPSNCHLVGPHENVDTSINNQTVPYGTIGGALILNSARIIALGGGGSICGLVIHRKGMTFPIANTSAYAGDAINAYGDGAMVRDCLILGFDRAFYSNGWSRLLCERVKFDCLTGIDIRNSGDTSRILFCHGWPFANPSGTALDIRSGSAFRLLGRNDWTLIMGCFSYGYYRGVELGNALTLDVSPITLGASSVRVIATGADNYFNSGTGLPGHANSLGFLVTGLCFDVLFSDCQAAANESAGLYCSVDAGYNVRVDNLYVWNKSSHGVLFDGLGDLSVLGGNIDGCTYGVTYNTTGGAGRLVIDGGLRLRGIVTAQVRIGVATTNVFLGDILYDESCPIHDNNALVAPILTSATNLALPNNGEIFGLSGVTSISNLGLPVRNRRIGFLVINGLTFIDGANLHVAGGVNYAAPAGSYIEFVGIGTQWREVARSA